jgi:hypothetical protein
MQIRRPLAALMTALALFGGGATLTACGDPAGTDRSDGTSDDPGAGEGTDNTNQEEEEDNGSLPNNSDPENESEDGDDDSQDPD